MATLVRSRMRRTQQVVSLRSALPVQLLTLHHDIPTYLPADMVAQEDITTPKVSDPDNRPGETPARKGG